MKEWGRQNSRKIKDIEKLCRRNWSRYYDERYSSSVNRWKTNFLADFLFLFSGTHSFSFLLPLTFPFFTLNFMSAFLPIFFLCCHFYFFSYPFYLFFYDKSVLPNPFSISVSRGFLCFFSLNHQANI